MEKHLEYGDFGFFPDRDTVKISSLMAENGIDIERYKASLVKDTSYKGLWKVSFTLKEF